MKPVEQEIIELRLMAAIQDENAKGRLRHGLSDADCIEAAQAYRVRADLLEQGVPREAINTDVLGLYTHRPSRK